MCPLAQCGSGKPGCLGSRSAPGRGYVETERRGGGRGGGRGRRGGVRGLERGRGAETWVSVSLPLYA